MCVHVLSWPQANAGSALRLCVRVVMSLIRSIGYGCQSSSWSVKQAPFVSESLVSPVVGFGPLILQTQVEFIWCLLVIMGVYFVLPFRVPIRFLLDRADMGHRASPDDGVRYR